MDSSKKTLKIEVQKYINTFIEMKEYQKTIS